LVGSAVRRRRAQGEAVRGDAHVAEQVAVLRRVSRPQALLDELPHIQKHGRDEFANNRRRRKSQERSPHDLIVRY